MSVILSRQIVLPTMCTPASDLAEGSIVYLKEDGTLVPFYVAQHNYQSGLNGAGRTLLVRQYVYGSGKWDASGSDTYAGSTVDQWCTNTYFPLLDAAVRSAIGETSFYSTAGNYSTTVNVLVRSVFILSLYETHGDTSYAGSGNEGSLVMNGGLQVAYNSSGTAITQFTRTPNTSQTKVYRIAANGGYSIIGPATSSNYRPCFTIPSSAKFNPDTNEFVGV